MNRGANLSAACSRWSPCRVERTPHPHDRRSLQLQLTPEGVRKVSAVYDAFESQVLEAVEAVPESQVRAANEYLAVVARTVRARGA